MKIPGKLLFVPTLFLACGFAAPAHAIQPIENITGEPQYQLPAGNSGLRVYEILVRFGEIFERTGVVLVPDLPDPEGRFDPAWEYWRWDLDALLDIDLVLELRFDVAADLSWDPEDAIEREGWINFHYQEQPVAVFELSQDESWMRTTRKPQGPETALFSSGNALGTRSYLRMSGPAFERGHGHGFMTWWVSLTEGDGFVGNDGNQFHLIREDMPLESFDGYQGQWPFILRVED